MTIAAANVFASMLPGAPPLTPVQADAGNFAAAVGDVLVPVAAVPVAPTTSIPTHAIAAGLTVGEVRAPAAMPSAIFAPTDDMAGADAPVGAVVEPEPGPALPPLTTDMMPASPRSSEDFAELTASDPVTPDTVTPDTGSSTETTPPTPFAPETVPAPEMVPALVIGATFIEASPDTSRARDGKAREGQPSASWTSARSGMAAAPLPSAASPIDASATPSVFADRIATVASPGAASPIIADGSSVPAPTVAPTNPTGMTTPVAPSAGPAQATFTQAIASQPTPAPQPATPQVDARPGRIGRELGVEIARRIRGGGEELTVRLNPPEMGRIEVRLSFDDRGSLRAVVAAESIAALEMLRRDSADLGRALTDAGVRADANSFRFDSRSGGSDGGQPWQRQQGNARGHERHPQDAAQLLPDAAYRPLRSGGRLDLMA